LRRGSFKAIEGSSVPQINRVDERLEGEDGAGAGDPEEVEKRKKRKMRMIRLMICRCVTWR
jgi:hypothetical protein